MWADRPARWAGLLDVLNPLPAPVPLEATSGIMPATKASVVIRIGRNRSRLASRIASARGMPSALGRPASRGASGYRNAERLALL